MCLHVARHIVHPDSEAATTVPGRIRGSIAPRWRQHRDRSASASPSSFSGTTHHHLLQQQDPVVLERQCRRRVREELQRSASPRPAPTPPRHGRHLQRPGTSRQAACKVTTAAAKMEESRPNKQTVPDRATARRDADLFYFRGRSTAGANPILAWCSGRNSQRHNCNDAGRKLIDEAHWLGREIDQIAQDYASSLPVYLQHW